ncbi:protein phosphatase 1 regulatory subunit 1B-like [Chanos chanos]|uniref:Protein phosphatase 1 regulatory subunit 1B n=1 Tax=Chanos chanos TaxID=29144 RepID=A0A6J2VG27_CHACN|nr:protein phosphatase 1 regulatory subunit 1B-like [Chanos chanos]
MDPLLPTEMEGEMKERRKIQFSVPSTISTQLDPQQVEMIRRRRPTPATLFRVTDHPSPEEENPSYQLAVNENGVHRPKKVNTAVYQPPSLKAVQKMAEAHIQALATYVPLEGPAEGRERQGGSISFGSENVSINSVNCMVVQWVALLPHREKPWVQFMVSSSTLHYPN